MSAYEGVPKLAHRVALRNSTGVRIMVAQPPGLQGQPTGQPPGAANRHKFFMTGVVLIVVSFSVTWSESMKQSRWLRELSAAEEADGECLAPHPGKPQTRRFACQNHFSRMHLCNHGV